LNVHHYAIGYSEMKNKFQRLGSIVHQKSACRLRV
jgi:hypothetical protein